jgi:hypothetical protein
VDRGGAARDLVLTGARSARGRNDPQRRGAYVLAARAPG